MAKLNLGVQRLVHGYRLAGIGSVTSQNGSQGTHGAVIALVVNLTLGQGIDQIKLLLLVTADVLASETPRIALLGHDGGAVDV